MFKTKVNKFVILNKLCFLKVQLNHFFSTEVCKKWQNYIVFWIVFVVQHIVIKDLNKLMTVITHLMIEVIINLFKK